MKKVKCDKKVVKKSTTVKSPTKQYLTVYKNTDPEVLEEVLRMMKEENPDAKITIVYDGETKEEDLSTLPPSKIKSRYWIQVIRKKGKYPKDTERSGKWLIFSDKNEIDQIWGRVKLLTENGHLGFASKVSTAKENPNAKKSDVGVICVYSYDWTDEKDVRRIREELRKIGITQKIPYKSDLDTIEKKYQVLGHKRISKYFE
ncbi:MAG: DUF1917 domain-containing protein [Cyclobacteriaceae bacterium]|nr:DUF1917 domain-containing protein [Cyclobacteriaceae bacterium]